MHRPLVVRIPLWLKAASAGSVGLLMIVFFEVGQSLGRQSAPVVVQVDTAPTPETVKPIVEPPAPVKAKPKEPPKKPEPKKPEPDLYANSIAPILRAKCVACHGGQSLKGNLDLRTLAAMKQGGDSGPAFVPGQIAKSKLWLSIDDGAMPPAGKPKLTPAEIQLIRKWIEIAN